MVVALDRMEASLAGRGAPLDWLVYVDCDAFFTDMTLDLRLLIAAVEQIKPGVNFIVAEDSGGINTGVFMVKVSPWSVEYFRRVAVAPYTTAWDQSEEEVALESPGFQVNFFGRR